MTNEEAINILKSKMDGSVDTSYEWAETVRMAIKALKQPERKTGKWKMALTKDLNGFNTVCFRCSECNGMEYGTSPFCRMCGANMEEGD